MGKTGRLFLSLFGSIGWTGALIYAVHYRQVDSDAILFALAALYLGAFLFFIVLRGMGDRLRQIKLVMFFVAALLSVGLMLLVDIRFSRCYYYEDTSIFIQPAGISGPASADVETWLTGIRLNGKQMGLETVERDGNWIMLEGSLVSPPGQSGTLTVHTNGAYSVELTFAVNTWAGLVQVHSDQGSETIDLYEPDLTLGTKTFDLSDLRDKTIPQAQQRRLLFYGLEFTLLYLLWVSLLPYIWPCSKEGGIRAT